LVFRNGTPYVSGGLPSIARPGTRPGVAGGGPMPTGPDLLINGISTGTGLEVNSGNATTPNGNQLVVYAGSENPLTDEVGGADIFGFGNAILQPGFQATKAFDTITVDTANLNTVHTVNNHFGALVDVRMDVASYDHSPGVATPGLVVDGGDESSVQAS